MPFEVSSLNDIDTFKSTNNSAAMRSIYSTCRGRGQLLPSTHPEDRILGFTLTIQPPRKLGRFILYAAARTWCRVIHYVQAESQREARQLANRFIQPR